jgi:putative ABC transport system permease protein
VDENNTISDYSYYALGLAGDYRKVLTSGIYKQNVNPLSYSDILNLKFKVILPCSTYVKDGEPITVNGKSVQLYKDNLSADTLSTYYNDAEIEMKVVGIIRPKPNLAATSISSTIAYSPKLTLKAMELNKQNEVYEAQANNTEVSVLSGKILSDSSLSLEQRVEAYLNTLSSEEADAKRNEFNNIAVKNYFKTSFETTISSLISLGLDIKGVKVEYNDLDSEGNVISSGSEQYATLDELYSNVFETNTLQSFVAKYIASSSRTYTQYVFIDSSNEEIDLTNLTETKGVSVQYSYLLAYYYALEQYYGEEFETYDSVMNTLQVCDEDNPSSISIYAKSFADKDNIVNAISSYNTKYPTKAINYTDYVGIMMSSITTILNAVTYVLIGFVSISLIVSSIMIAIITYISVLERTKEIGILRSIGASKGDVSNIFNAETIFIGLLSGVIGVVSCIVLDIPINIIINNIANIGSIASLPWQGGVALIIISILLSFVAGLIPARIAATRDPVIALRSE